MKSKKQDERFSVGTVVGAHALRGTLKVRPTTNNPTLLLDIETVEVQLPLPGNPVEIAHVRNIKLDKNLFFIDLKEYTDRDAAEGLIGAEIFTSRDQLLELEEDEWWIDDLIGLPVFTPDGKQVGVVAAIIHGAGELLEIRKEGGTESDTALVPFVKALVPKVDLTARRIEITDLPGLLD